LTETVDIFVGQTGHRSVAENGFHEVVCLVFGLDDETLTVLSLLCRKAKQSGFEGFESDATRGRIELPAVLVGKVASKRILLIEGLE
jgi:hypothetical protein